MSSLVGTPVPLHTTVEGQGEPVLLLHGLGSRGADWRLQIPVLAERYRVVVPDLRGHGASPKPHGPYTIPQMTADVVELMDVLDLCPAHVIGLSMGGMIAFQLAVDRPQCVRSLIIVNSTPELIPRNLSEKVQVFQRRWLARVAGPRRTGQFLSHRLFPKPEQGLFREMLVAEWARNDKRAYLAAMDACIGWSVREQISGITCPVLVVSGDRDYLPLDAKREYTAMIPNARLVVVADSGHATPIDQAGEFNRLVLEYLSETHEPAGSLCD